MSNLSFTPQAKPVETFFKIPNPQEVKPDTRLSELAAALKEFQKPTERILDKTYEAHSRYSHGEGKRLAALHKDWEQAIAQGEKHVTESPFFQKGFLEGQGRLQGLAYLETINAAYESWEGKNQIDAKTLGTPEASKSFLEFIAKVRAPFIENAPNGDWLNGFQPIMEMAESNITNHHLAHKRAFLKEARYKQLDQETFSIVKSGLPPQEIVQQTEERNQQALFEGLDAHEVHERTRTAILATVVEMGRGGDYYRADAILKALPQTSAEDKVKINHVHEVLDNHVYTQEGRAHHRIEQNKKEAYGKAKQNIALNLLSNINWQDSPQNIKRMVERGVVEYPYMIEAIRGEFCKIPEEVNVQESLKFKADLYRGTLTDDDIFTSKLSYEKKGEYLKINAARRDFISDARVTAMKHKIKEHFAPTDIEKMTPGSGAMQYEAEGALLTELHRLYEGTPGIINDPVAFHNALKNIAEGVIKIFDTKKQEQKNLAKRQKELAVQQKK